MRQVAASPIAALPSRQNPRTASNAHPTPDERRTSVFVSVGHPPTENGLPMNRGHTGSLGTPLFDTPVQNTERAQRSNSFHLGFTDRPRSRHTPWVSTPRRFSNADERKVPTHAHQPNPTRRRGLCGVRDRRDDCREQRRDRLRRHAAHDRCCDLHRAARDVPRQPPRWCGRRQRHDRRVERERQRRYEHRRRRHHDDRRVLRGHQGER
jgi:hypothetical protein